MGIAQNSADLGGKTPRIHVSVGPELLTNGLKAISRPRRIGIPKTSGFKPREGFRVKRNGFRRQFLFLSELRAQLPSLLQNASSCFGRHQNFDAH
jgi:hypothetical protein